MENLARDFCTKTGKIAARGLKSQVNRNTVAKFCCADLKTKSTRQKEFPNTIETQKMRCRCDTTAEETSSLADLWPQTKCF